MTPEALELAKRIAASIWTEYDNTYGYVDEKLQMLEQADSQDPILIWGMFDSDNKRKFRQRLLAMPGTLVTQEVDMWWGHLAFEQAAAATLREYGRSHHKSPDHGSESELAPNNDDDGYQDVARD
jgi:hypothetical protein